MGTTAGFIGTTAGFIGTTAGLIGTAGFTGTTGGLIGTTAGLTGTGTTLGTTGGLTTDIPGLALKTFGAITGGLIGGKGGLTAGLGGAITGLTGTTPGLTGTGAMSGLGATTGGTILPGIGRALSWFSWPSATSSTCSSWTSASPCSSTNSPSTWAYWGWVITIVVPSLNCIEAIVLTSIPLISSVVISKSAILYIFNKNDFDYIIFCWFIGWKSNYNEFMYFMFFI